jgi:hypothetical protein
VRTVEDAGPYGEEFRSLVGGDVLGAPFLQIKIFYAQGGANCLTKISTSLLDFYKIICYIIGW